MSWKIVRDKNEQWCREHAVSGQWRISPDPVSALTRKIFEEAGEFAENRDPAELYDLADVVARLIAILDRDGSYASRNKRKWAEMGGFDGLVEWNPVPGGV